MTHDEAVEVLNEHQYGWIKHPPTKVCEALDYAIACLSKTEENERQSDLSLKTKAQDHSEQVLDMVTQFDERVAKLNEQYGYPFEPMPYRMMISYVASRNNVAEMLTLIAEMQAHIRKLEASLEIAEDTANHFKLAYENIIVNRIREEAGI